MASKAWPDEKSVEFDDLCEPVCKALRFAYKLQRQNEGSSIPWTGLDLGQRELVCSPSPDDKLSASSLQFDDEDQGRDALEVIVAIAVQLGIEQGRRMERSEYRPNRELAVLLAEQVLRDNK